MNYPNCPILSLHDALPICSLNVLPWSRLVASSMALAFGRSSVTSRRAPRRLLRTTSGLGSDIGIAPPDDERVGGKSAAALGCYDERIDLQLHDRDRLAERKQIGRASGWERVGQ